MEKGEKAMGRFIDMDKLVLPKGTVQKGRIFAHKFDLLQIERLEVKQNDM